MPTWPLRVLLAAALATGPVQAQEIPPPAYQLAAQRAGIPSTVLYAVALQHEMDHLDGKVFVQYLSRLKRDSVKRKMNKIKKSGIDDGVEAAANL